MIPFSPFSPSRIRRSARQGRPFVFDSQKLPDGLFRALVKMNGETEGEGFGETAKLAQREAASFVLQKYHQLPSQSLNRQRGPDLAIEDRLSAIFQVRISRDDIALDLSPAFASTVDIFSIFPCNTWFACISQGKHQELIFEVVKAAQDRLGVDVDSLTEVPAAGFLLQRGKTGFGDEQVVSLGIGSVSRVVVIYY